MIADVPLCEPHDQAVRDACLEAAQPPAFVAGTVVYYVGWRDRPDVVKIGTTQNLRKRLRGLGSTTRPAAVLVAEPGSYYLEGKRHRQFAHLRIDDGTRETYQWTPQLADHVQHVRQEVGWSGGARILSTL